MTRDETLIQEGIKLGILNAIEPDTEELLVRSILSNAVEEILTTFNKQNNSLLASAGDEYRDIVNKVSSQVLAGTKTTNKAMQEAVSQLAEKGLTGFTARNGARWSTEAYTKMVIRSNTRNTINRIQEERIKNSGGNYIEVSSHIGARPLCAKDQGQVFSFNGDTTPIEDLYGNRINVRAWSSSTRGEPAGIFGINCRHSGHMFIPGISVKREMDFTKAENDETYIESQKQRLYERTIRNKKRDIAMLKQTGAEPSYIRRKQNSLSNTRKEYLEFLDKTGRTRITANEWIGSSTISPKNSTKIITPYQSKKKKNGSNQLTKQDIGFIKDWVSSDSYKINDLLRNNRKISKEWKTKINGINNAIKKQPKYEGNIVRVLEINDLSSFLKDYEIDKPIKYKEFLSFSDKEGYNNKANVKIYVVSKHGRDIRDFNQDESEILYPTDSSFIVKNIKQQDGVVYILLEE